MLNVLLESRAGRQRRSGGAMLSVAVHMAIITAVAVGTVTATPAPRLDKPKPVILVQPAARRARVASDPAISRSPREPALPPNIVIRRVEAPPLVPRELPPIDMSHGSSADTIIIGGAPASGGLAGAVGNILDGDGGTGTRGEWNASEVLMHIVTAAKPRYPESLRSAGIDGRVLVEFVVDTAGRVDLATVKILSSTHDLFTGAVKAALPAMRFHPAEAGGKRVAALAQMPFEFNLR